MRQSYHDSSHCQSGYGCVDSVVGVDIADFFDRRAEDGVGSFVDERAKAVDRHVLDIAVTIVECVDEAVDDSRASGVIVNEEGGSTRLEHSVEVIEGHVANIGVRIAESG